MHFTKLLQSTTISLSISIAVLSPQALAETTGCKLNGVILDCSQEGTSPELIAKSFASEATRKALSNPLSQKAAFQKNGNLEKYRASMENNWRVITRLSRQKERNRRFGRSSSSDFQSWNTQFAQAKQSYAVAINFYRQLHWQGFK